MKKIFAIAMLFASVAMVACGGANGSKAAEADETQECCCEGCCEEKDECCGECCAEGEAETEAVEAEAEAQAE